MLIEEDEFLLLKLSGANTCLYNLFSARYEGENHYHFIFCFGVEHLAAMPCHAMLKELDVGVFSVFYFMQNF